MIEIDGAQGEGGGQVLRTALSLSVITQQPTRITNIRQRRSNPGLQPQHLACVDAAAAISRAQVEGARRGSQEISFWPGEVRTGRYRFEIQTAGSTSLVLQTIILPLSQAGSTSSVTITGGTHVPWSPSFHYLEQHWLPLLNWMGYSTSLELLQAGYYPRGGGRIQATIRPCAALQPLQVDTLQAARRLRGISIVSNLDRSIAERQKRQAVLRLLPYFPDLQVKVEQINAPSPGTHVLLKVDDPSASGAPLGGCYTALGERGKPAERVADEAIDQIIAFTQTRACVDRFMADQILLPLALLKTPCWYSTDAISEHLLTNAEIIRRFLPVDIRIEGLPGEPGQVSIQQVN
jgi:RNA 3'-phosphate cyclase